MYILSSCRRQAPLTLTFFPRVFNRTGRAQGREHRPGQGLSLGGHLADARQYLGQAGPPLLYRLFYDNALNQSPPQETLIEETLI